MEKNKQIEIIIKILKKQNYGLSMLAGFGGKNADPFKILIATVLSPRAKDQQTIPIVEKLWKKFNTPQKIWESSILELEEIIRPIGFYHVKSQRIKQVSKMLLDDFNGKVPDNETDLLTLPGVGRKVANCVLVYSFDADVIPVDIHVHRISNRLGWVKTKTPEETEVELMKIIPKKLRKEINENFVLHGQNICKPINPMCEICPINKHCEKII